MMTLRLIIRRDLSAMCVRVAGERVSPIAGNNRTEESQQTLIRHM